jgi:hypothetical protein
VEERINFVNSWFNRYNEMIEGEVKNIDDYIRKVKYIKEI